MLELALAAHLAEMEVLLLTIAQLFRGMLRQQAQESMLWVFPQAA